jgi:hypothetical protein
VPDSLRKYSPFHDPTATVIGNGYRNKLGTTAQGGSDAVRYFLSGEREQEVGIIKLPDFEQARFDSAGITPADYTTRPNNQYKYSFRGNVNASPMPSLDLSFNSNYIHVNTDYATESNATAFSAPRFTATGRGPRATPSRSSTSSGSIAS